MYAKQEGSRQPGTEPAEKVRGPMNRERRTPKDDVKDTGRFFSLGCVTSQALMEIHCHGHPQKGPVHFLIPWTLQAYYPGSKGRAAATDNPPNPSHFETSKCQQELLLAFTERKKINLRREGIQFRKDFSLTIVKPINPDFPRTPRKRLCTVTQLYPTVCNPVDYITPGFPVLHHLMEFAQTHM